GCQMPSRGESPNPDAVRLDPELIGAHPDITYRALRIVERSGVMISRTKPVFKDEPGDPARVQPLGDLRALFVHREIPITTAGTDYDLGAGSLLGRWQIDADGRPIPILSSQRARRAIRPKQLDALRRCG